MKKLIHLFKKYRRERISKKIILSLLANQKTNPQDIGYYFESCIKIIYPDWFKDEDPS
jgi:hypothetical protein